METSCLKLIPWQRLTFSPRQRTLVTLATVFRGAMWLEPALGPLTITWEHSMELPQPVNVSETEVDKLSRNEEKRSI